MKNIYIIMCSLFISVILSGCGIFWGNTKDIENKDLSSNVSKTYEQKALEKESDINKDTYDSQVQSKIVIPQFVINTNQNDYKSFPICGNEKYKEVYNSYMGTTKTYPIEIETISDNNGTLKTNIKTSELKDGYELNIKQCIDKGQDGLKTVFDIKLYTIDNSSNLIARQSVNHISTYFTMNLDKMLKCSDISYTRNILSTIKTLSGNDILGKEIQLKDGVNIDFFTCLTSNRNVLGDVTLETFSIVKNKIK